MQYLVMYNLKLLQKESIDDLKRKNEQVEIIEIMKEIKPRTQEP